jgi:uncharacterized membrane protein YdfJ with MMPL/SSD domain
MKIMRYVLFIAGIVMAEGAVVYGLYFFAGEFRTVYIIFSLAVVFAMLFYLIYGRYREQIKIRHKNEVRKKYLKTAFTALVVIFSLTAVSVTLTGLYLLALKILRG